LLVQANIGNAEKMAAEFGRGFYQQILHKYFAATDKGLDKYADQPIDFILWSEACTSNVLKLASGLGCHALVLKPKALSKANTIMTRTRMLRPFLSALCCQA
jgi:hypothetical protein